MSVAAPAPSTTTISTKRQVVLPNAVCNRRGWKPGTRLVVEDTPEGVLLKVARPFPETTWEEVFGILKYDGPPLPVDALSFNPDVEPYRDSG